MKPNVLFLSALMALSAGSARADVVINEANFPDENFRSYLQEQTYGTDGIITDAEIAGVTIIDVSKREIQSLQGIEFFTALTDLDCYDNQLTALDISKNTALTDLHCDYNQLTALDVTKNTALTRLDCRFNQLTALDISKNTALKILNCSHNQLTALDVSKNTALTDLDCYYNQLTALDVSKNTALTGLQCYNNPLTSLDVTKNTALQYLQCHGNQLTSLDVSKNTALTRLYCDLNQLTALDISKNTALKILNCSHNQLTALDVSKNTALTDLDCYYNKLTALDVSNTALKSLNCRFNQLTTLDVSKNTALTELHCYNNQLTALDISKNTALTELHCHYNKLTALDISKNTALQYLQCQYNQLTALDVSNTALKSLNCSSNQLTALDVSNTALTWLYCYRNQIKGAGMDALIESLPTKNNAPLYVMYNPNEQNVMTTTQVAAAKAKGWTPFSYNGTDWVEYAGSATYSTSVNIEQLVLDNGVKYDITKDFIDSYIEYASINALDTLNDLENKAMRNEPYLGLKLKTAGAYIKVLVKKGSTLNVKFGAVKEALGVSINGTAKEAIAATDEGTTYSYTAEDADAEVVFTTASNKTVVFKQIMIDEPLADVTLPEPGAYLITVATPENGTAAVDWANKKYRTPVGAEVTVTATPAEGYELNSISVTGAISNTAYIVTDGKFTMPAEEVTVSASFKQITGVNNVNANGNVNQNAKVIKNGKLIIIKNGKEYSANGSAVE